MAFSVLDLNEKTWSGYKSRIVSQWYSRQFEYMADKERNLVVIPLGGDGDRPRERAEAPSYYCLFWKGLEIGFNGFHEESRINYAKTIKMEVDNLYLPKELEGDIAGIKQAIIEALDAYWSYRRRGPVTFEIVFPNPTFR